MTFMKLKSERDIELHSLKTIKIIVYPIMTLSL